MLKVKLFTFHNVGYSDTMRQRAEDEINAFLARESYSPVQFVTQSDASVGHHDDLENVTVIAVWYRDATFGADR